MSDEKTCGYCRKPIQPGEWMSYDHGIPSWVHRVGEDYSPFDVCQPVPVGRNS